MLNTYKIYEELKEVFGEEGAKRLAGVLFAMYEEVAKTVTKEEFKELKEVVSELTAAQKRTEGDIQELKKVVSELAEAQKRTEGEIQELKKSVSELAEAQKRTEEELRELARDQRRLRSEVGGLAMSVSYGFENEVYRLLPDFLKKNFGINIKKRLIRIEIAGKEVNIFGKGVKNGKQVFVVGEVKLRITDRKDQERAIKDIEGKVKAVTSEYGKVNLIKLIITHFARKSFLERAEREGIIVVQSFEL